MTLQATASKSALLLQCPRPFSKSVETEHQEPGEAALYGTKFHAAIAEWLTKRELHKGGMLEELLLTDDDLLRHVENAYAELQAWMRWDGNPFNLDFKVVGVEVSRALNLFLEDSEARPIILNDADGAHDYGPLGVLDMAGTADVVLEAMEPNQEGLGPFRVVLDHKTGEYGDYSNPAANSQMQALALMFRADAVAILHTPRGSAPIIYAEEFNNPMNILSERFRDSLLRIDSGFLRPGPECRFCPARATCPAKQGELIASAAALVETTLSHRGALLAQKTPLTAGQFHMMRAELTHLIDTALSEIREDIRGGAVIERPDGKTLSLEKRMVERLSKKSILDAYGKERGEEVLAKLRADGALVEIEQEELRAK
jgi:hypothetical protein